MTKELDNKKMWESILNPKYHSEVMDALRPHIKDALKDQGLKFDGENIVPIEPDKIEAGKWYVCIGSLFSSPKTPMFTNGLLYKSPKDDFLVRSDNGNPEIIGAFHIKHFRPATEEEIAASGQNENQIGGQIGGQKPKFKVGDWVVDTDDTEREAMQIKGILDVGYTTVQGSFFDFREENKFHLWTIADAKDGDVLSFNDGHGNDSIELIKSITDKKIEFWFCLTNGNSYEVFDGIIPYTNLVSRKNAIPATKEQRDLLFQKMKEAGYIFDFEKKELKKIEHKPTEDVDLPEFESYLCLMFQKFRTKGMCTNGEIIDYVNEHSQKLRDILVKTAWSEEDDNIIEWLIGYLEYQIMNATITEEKNNCLNAISMLKSLKDRYTWKPSEKQMETLVSAIDVMIDNRGAGDKNTILLSGLYHELKTL